MSETERMNFQNWGDTSVLFWPILETSGGKNPNYLEVFLDYPKKNSWDQDGSLEVRATQQSS